MEKLEATKVDQSSNRALAGNKLAKEIESCTEHVLGYSVSEGEAMLG
jgi:hypothetical protein